ncbi:hypothetical protein [Altererythrobacter fulvus]|uniref:hypothetical protein n=1 Tax=Caenibius fulvus TaxID=2126012 RepID=UPI003016FBBE
MSDDNSGWPAKPAILAKLDSGLAPIAPLAGGSQVAERDGQGRFLSGNNGGGRKKGSRNRLTETFLAAIEGDFAEHGADALEKLRTDDPAAYLRIIASLVPRGLILKREQEPDFSDMADEELAEMFGRAFRNRKIRRDLDMLTR